MIEPRTSAEHVADELAADPPELDFNERLLLAAFEGEIAQGAAPVRLQVDWPVAWAILARSSWHAGHINSSVSQTRDVVEGFARHLQERLVIGPASAAIAERGWRSEFDVPFPEGEGAGSYGPRPTGKPNQS